jgi:ribonuclease HII
MKLSAAEKRRLEKLKRYEKEARLNGFHTIAGVDEAGRGPLAGPVVAAACILPEGFVLKGINDSKQLDADARAELFKQLTENPEVIYGVGVIDSTIIDEINILRATFEGMLLAVSRLSKTPDYILIDGPFSPNFGVKTQPLIDGDALSISIAAASIIAKETRDRIMIEYHKEWPQFRFDKHKGYGTEAHALELKTHGPCPIHRKSFAPVKLTLTK